MTLTRTAASAAVDGIGWRYILGAFQTSVVVGSLADAAKVAGLAAAVGNEHLRIDLRADRVELALQPPAGTVTESDVELAHGITDVVRDLGFDTVPAPAQGRALQNLEIAIDALDIEAIRPFWKAVLAYDDELGYDGPLDSLIDPLRQGPAVWFQQMDEPRPQRNRIHFDITVPHELAVQRIDAALAAGGSMVSDKAARSFWILADPEGNEICVCTWLDRDEREAARTSQ